MLQKGDTVVMHDCGEAGHYEGVIWTCRSGEGDLCSNRVVWLEDFSGGFAVKYLRKVDVSKEETVICQGCDKLILADSKGYTVLLESEGVYCIQCEKKNSERMQAQAFVHNAMNEFEMSHTVFKNAHVEKLHLENKRDLAYIEACISDIRIQEGKHPYPEYIVINKDEDPQMVKEIIEVMKRFNKWG